jgi:hypothetical protein
MARRPFFSGNYGSALGSTANAANLIARAGETQGRMLANMGAQIGGMIQQYGLNKEKREAEERTAIGNLSNFSPQDLLQLEQTNPELGRAVKNLLGGKGGKKDVDTINAGTAPFVANKARELDTRFKTAQIQGIEFENKFNKANEENRLLRSTLETESMQILNKYKDLQLEVLGIERDIKSNERDIDRDKKYAELEQKKLTLKNLRQDIQSKKNTNSVFAEQLDRERTEFAVDMSQTMSSLAINAEKLDQLMASRDVDQKTKEENLKILKTERKQLEQELTNQQNLLNSLSVDSADEDTDFIKEIDIGDAFQGGPLLGKDAAGLFYSVVGGLGSTFGADITPETTSQTQNLLTLETFLLPALVSDISSRPSNFNLEIARQKIPLPSDTNAVGRAKIEQLIPDLKLRLKEAENTIATAKTDASYFQEAQRQASRIRKIIPVLENSLKGKSPSLNAGKTSNNVGFRIVNRGQR